MKKNLRILALCLVGVLAVNCSSDDNSSPKEENKTKELKVIDSSIYSSFDNDKLIEDVTITYFYNEDGTVNHTEEITKGYDDKKEVDKEILTYTYENNLPFALTQETFLANNTTDYWDLQYTYENNRIVKADAINNKTEGNKTLYSFSYNTKGQLINTINSNQYTNNKRTYKYDVNGNLEEVNSDGMIELITYDDKKSPFTNMNISNQSYSMEFFEVHDQFLIRSPHNITQTIFDATNTNIINRTTHTLVNKYDKDDYLTTSTETVKNKKASELKYTYKTITVPVKEQK